MVLNKRREPWKYFILSVDFIVTKYESQPDSTHFLQPISPDNYDNLLWLGNSLEVP